MATAVAVGLARSSIVTRPLWRMRSGVIVVSPDCWAPAVRADEKRAGRASDEAAPRNVRRVGSCFLLVSEAADEWSDLHLVIHRDKEIVRPWARRRSKHAARGKKAAKRSQGKVNRAYITHRSASWLRAESIRARDQRAAERWLDCQDHRRLPDLIGCGSGFSILLLLRSSFLSRMPVFRTFLRSRGEVRHR